MNQDMYNAGHWSVKASIILQEATSPPHPTPSIKFTHPPYRSSLYKPTSRFAAFFWLRELQLFHIFVSWNVLFWYKHCHFTGAETPKGNDKPARVDEGTVGVQLSGLTSIKEMETSHVVFQWQQLGPRRANRRKLKVQSAEVVEAEASIYLFPSWKYTTVLSKMII